jgi:glycosyltransferase involved in cell wall biosynthesis
VSYRECVIVESPERTSVSDQITVVIVNYRTRELTQRAIESLLRHYPSVPLLLIDNGSHDHSTTLLRDMERQHPNVSTVVNETNRNHGPGMDQGIKQARTQFVFTLDSDCEVISGGFLEKMSELFVDERLYAVGEVRYKNRFGYTYGYADVDGWDERAQPENRRRIPYVHPYAMLLDRAKYEKLHPFAHHGAPCIKNMYDARRAGYVVRYFPIENYIIHHAEGTSANHHYDVWFRSKQLIEWALSTLQGFVLRDPVLKVQKRRDRQDR